MKMLIVRNLRIIFFFLRLDEEGHEFNQMKGLRSKVVSLINEDIW